MEKVKFVYEFVDDEYGENRCITFNKEDEESGISCDQICGMFVDYMNAAGFSEDLVYKYFKD